LSLAADKSELNPCILSWVCCVSCCLLGDVLVNNDALLSQTADFAFPFDFSVALHSQACLSSAVTVAGRHFLSDSVGAVLRLSDVSCFYWGDFWPTSLSQMCWFQLIPQPTISLHLHKIALNKSPLSGGGESTRCFSEKCSD